MGDAKGKPPIQKRATVWIASVVVGLAMYSLFDKVLVAPPARELASVRGFIAQVPAEAPPPSENVTPEEAKVAAKAAEAEYRATRSLVSVLYRRKGELEDECRRYHFWAMVVGLIAGVGSFVLCTVYWRRQSAEGEVAAAPAAADDAHEAEEPA